MKKHYFFCLLLVQSLIIGQAAAQTYVDAAARGSNNGTSWLNAYTNLQTAITNTASGNEVWVAAGTYTPAASNSFTMKEGVKVISPIIMVSLQALQIKFQLLTLLLVPKPLAHQPA